MNIPSFLCHCKSKTAYLSNSKKMLLKIVVVTATTLVLGNIIKNIRNNYAMTTELPPKSRRKLLWQYGPFMMHQDVINQMEKVENRD